MFRMPEIDRSRGKLKGKPKEIIKLNVFIFGQTILSDVYET
jgi:hypothetical protein